VTIILGLILGPFLVGAGLLVVRANSLRRLLVGGAVIAVCCLTLALTFLHSPTVVSRLPLNHHWISLAMLAIELAMAVYVVYVGARARQALIVLLMLAQAGLMTWFECTQGSNLETATNLFVDGLSVIMALINGLVGGGICLYALGYMSEYHGKGAHSDVVDRRPLFFALLFIFMGAMFGLIFSNNLLWLFLFWEITTLCSFLLIGYTQTAEARRNALRALVMNLGGGLAFALGIVCLHRQAHTIELQTLIKSGHALALLPAALLCFAGITKSAQLPFSGWLLGAMVAPTPVSALLHSSTMVKAGVYLVLRLAPVVSGTTVGMMVALTGALTFVVGSFAAITTSDAKKVLAYSTVANLGLIVLCGGIGTYQAVWAGVLLIIFHALAKCLLFLCVGVVEQKLHSRDIEAMSGLLLNMRRLGIMMLIGMAGMFLAPFGMLISKWAVLKAVVDAYPALSAFIVFGSAATLFFWVKWMGKLLQVVRPHQKIEDGLVLGEAIALYGLSASTFLACLLFPLISTHFIDPYITSAYDGLSASMSQGNIIIMTIMMVMIMLFPLSYIHYGHGVKVMDAYLGGANVHSSVRFLGSANVVHDVTMNNYYLRGFLSEKRLGWWGGAGATLLLAVMVVAAAFGAESEIRRPKAEGNPNSEIQSTESKAQSPLSKILRPTDISIACASNFGFRISDSGLHSDFGFRASDLFRISDFEFRISHLPS
jgi:ech hydrogenase subunit A